MSFGADWSVLVKNNRIEYWRVLFQDPDHLRVTQLGNGEVEEILFGEMIL